MDNFYTKMRSLDVSKYVEKKGALSYLSWAWAVDQLLQNDPSATWEYKEPQLFGQTMMVFCSVTAFNKTMTCQLPVMDHRNKAIANPDAFQVNTAMQRCLAKAIALHGIGLYIYAGEDICPEPALTQDQITMITDAALEKGIPIQKICSAAKVNDIKDIPFSQYESLIHRIMSAKSKHEEKPNEISQ